MVTISGTIGKILYGFKFCRESLTNAEQQSDTAT